MNIRNLTKKSRLHVITSSIFLAIVLVFSIIFTATVKGEQTEQDIFYKSVLVQSRDTFWTIAKEYNNLDIDHCDYVEKLQQMNKTSGQDITPGDYIVVAYYKK